MYCTYLTTYLGNKLPPFYIGFSTVKNIEKGYHGSVESQKYKSIWLDELKNSPQLFKTKILTRHKTSKAANQKELELQTPLKVHINPLYINQSAWPHFNITNNKEILSKISQTKKAQQRRWITNEKKEEYIFKSSQIPSGWRYGRLKPSIKIAGMFKGKTGIYSEKTLQKMREAKLGKSSWNKGLTIENDKRVAKHAIALKGIHKSKPPWNKGLTKKDYKPNSH